MVMVSLGSLQAVFRKIAVLQTGGKPVARKPQAHQFQ